MPLPLAAVAANSIKAAASKVTKKVVKKTAKRTAQKAAGRGKKKSPTTKVLLTLCLLMAVVMFVQMTVVVSSITTFISAVGAGAAAQSEQDSQDTCDTGGGGIQGVNLRTGKVADLSPAQVKNAQWIIAAAKRNGLDKNAMIIGVMVSLVESTLKNLAAKGNGQDESANYPNDGVVTADHTSVGIMQQQTWWGSIKERMTPLTAAEKFFMGVPSSQIKGLTDFKWKSMPKGVAAQTVQVSRFPDKYAVYEKFATTIVTALEDTVSLDGQPTSQPSTPGSTANPVSFKTPAKRGHFGTNAFPVVNEPAKPASKLQWPMKQGTYTLTSTYGPRQSPGGVGSTYHRGIDLAAPIGTPIYAAADGVVTLAGPQAGTGYGIHIEHTIDGKTFSTGYGHMRLASFKVKVGDKVKAGQLIAGVGSEGNSTGPHLHFSMFTGAANYVDPLPVLKGAGYPDGIGVANSMCDPGSGVDGTGDMASFQKALKAYAWPQWHPDGWLKQMPSYAASVARAKAQGRFWGYDTQGRIDGNHCSVFISNLMFDSGWDKTYNYGTEVAKGAGFAIPTQATWLAKNWKVVGRGGQLVESNLKPGDIGINSGHVWVYVGKVAGFDGNYAEASYSYSGHSGFAPMARQSSEVLYASNPTTVYYRKKAA